MRSMNDGLTVKQLALSKHKNDQAERSNDTKARVSISINRDLLTQIDKLKGLASRSAFVEKLLKDQLNISDKEN